MDAVFSEQFKVSLYDVDVAGNPRLSRITERMLIAANDHLDLLDWSWEHLYKDFGVALVLVEVCINVIDRMPLGANMKLTTWTTGKGYPMMMRWFVIEDEAGGRKCEGMMSCVLMDVNARTITNAKKYGLALIELSAPPMEISIKRPRFTVKAEADENDPDFRLEKTVDLSDLDYNGHMNTARYVEATENLLGRDWFLNHTVTELNVRYEKETAYGETLKVLGSLREDEDGKRVEVTGTASGVERFMGRVRYFCPKLRKNG